MKKTWIYVLVIVVVVIVLIIALSKSEAPKQPEEEGVVPEERTFKEEVPSVSLTEMTPDGGYQGWGELSINKSVQGNSLKVGGVEHEKGLGTHAQSSWKYTIPEGYNYFETSIGLDDGVIPGENLAVFVVKGDEKELYRSDPMKPGQAAVSVKVSVTGIQEIFLITEDGGDGVQGDVTDWLNPVLIP